MRGNEIETANRRQGRALSLQPLGRNESLGNFDLSEFFMAELQLVLVTPEKTLLDESVASLRFPLYDGQIGILPGRAPLVGRLGYGELRLRTGEGDRSYYIDGGFVQVKGSVVSLLTERALQPDQIDPEATRTRLQEAIQQPARTDRDIAARFREQERARRMLDVVRQR